MPPTTVSRGDVFWVDLDPIVGHEQAGRRPCVVVSTNAIHSLGVAIVVPLTNNLKKLRSHKVIIQGREFLVEKGEAGTGGGDSMALVYQIRMVAFDRFDPVRVARVSPAGLAGIEASLVFCLEIF